MIGTLPLLLRFLSCAGDKSIHFFAMLKKAKSFQWTGDCESAFRKLKVFISSLPILTCPKERADLILYYWVTKKALSLILIQDDEEVERSIYFVSRVLKGAQLQYRR